MHLWRVKHYGVTVSNSLRWGVEEVRPGREPNPVVCMCATEDEAKAVVETRRAAMEAAGIWRTLRDFWGRAVSLREGSGDLFVKLMKGLTGYISRGPNSALIRGEVGEDDVNQQPQDHPEPPEGTREFAVRTVWGAAPEFFPVSVALTDNKTISKNATCLLVWGYIASFQRRNKPCVSAISTIGQAIGKGRRSVQEACALLEEEGFLVREARFDKVGRRSNGWWAQVPFRHLEGRGTPHGGGAELRAGGARNSAHILEEPLTRTSPNGDGATRRTQPRNEKLNRQRGWLLAKFREKYGHWRKVPYAPVPSEGKQVGDAIESGTLEYFFELDEQQRERFIDRFFRWIERNELTPSIQAFLRNQNHIIEEHETGGRSGRMPTGEVLPNLADIGAEMRRVGEGIE